MNNNLSIEENIMEFNRRLAAWNADITADIDLYDFMELALDTLEGFDWIKSAAIAGLPIKTSRDPNEVVFEFADHFFDRWHDVHRSIIFTGRNSRGEVLDVLSPFVAKLCEVSGDTDRIMALCSPSASMAYANEMEVLKTKFPHVQKYVYNWLLRPELVRSEYDYRILAEKYDDLVHEYFFSVCGAEQRERLKAAIREANARKEAHELWQRAFSEVLRLRALAAECEKSARIDNACAYLEQAVSVGQSAGLNPNDYLAALERLFILYRKLKKYEDEERTILDAIELQSTSNHQICANRVNKYKERLIKCRTLLSKSKWNKNYE